MENLDHLRAIMVQREQRAALQMQQQHHGFLMINNQGIGGGALRPGMGIVNRYQGGIHPNGYQPLRPVRPPPPPARDGPTLRNVRMEEDILSFNGEPGEQTGVYIAPRPIEHYSNYFEIQLLDVGDLGQIAIGLVPDVYPPNAQPGMEPNSVGYMADTGKIFMNPGRGFRGSTHQGPACGLGDKIGIGVRPIDDNGRPEKKGRRVFFTRNGQEIKYMNIDVRFGSLYPAVGMQSEGEEVSLRLDAVWNPEDVTQMLVDCGEDDWLRLDDINLNGNILEYTGRGRLIHDVGLAQAKYPLDTTNHYFEFEIVDPGEKGYVAIGLARRNYPARRHPGWNHGSIAYHADDGKIFHGSGMGRHFGPRCSLGDVMGCGIFFPLDYEDDVGNEEDDVDGEFGGAVDEDGDEDAINNILWDSDDEDNPLLWQGGRNQRREKGRKVKVFFKRNGKLLGLREVNVPSGGFYPTIGMASLNERVRVDLRPLTG